VRALSSLRLRTNFAWIPIEPATTLMTFCVSVPVLSVQTTEALAILARTEEIFGGHSFRSESGDKGHSEWETLGNGRDDQCYGNG